MKNIYKIENMITVPDGTRLCEIIGPEQSHNAGLPVIDEHSLAYGELDPGEKSSVHVHPIISHLTWVISGKLTVGMKDKRNSEMYYLDVNPSETVLTEPGTFFQLINNNKEICKVLYIVSPAFVFEVAANGDVLYNDAMVLNLSWNDLAKQNWKIPELDDLETIRRKRNESLQRLKAHKSAKRY